MAEVGAARVHRGIDLEAQDKRATGARIAEPQRARLVAAVARRAEVERQVLHRRHRAGGAVVGPLPGLLALLEDDGAQVGERAHAAHAALGDEEQAAGGDEVDPATRALGAEVLDAEVAHQVVPRQRVGAEEHHVGTRSGAAAVVPGPRELPHHLLPGDGVDALLLPPCLQVERPRLGVELVADDQRANAVADPLRPKLAPVLRRQGGHAAELELPGEEVAPVVPVGVDAEEHQHVVAVDGPEGGVVGPAAAVGKVQRLLPQRLAGAGVEGAHQPHDGGLNLLVGLDPLEALQPRRGGDLLLQGRLPLLGAHREVHEVEPPGADGQRRVRDGLARVAPADGAGGRVQGEDDVAVGAAGAHRGVEQVAHARQVAPPPLLAVGRRRQLVGHRGLARGLVEAEARAAHRHEQAVGIGHEVAGLGRHDDAHRPGDLPLPQLAPVVGVVGHHHVLALHEELAVDRQRRGGAAVAVDHVAGAGVAEPQEAERAADELVVAARGVAWLGILVGPAPRAGERPAGELQPHAVLLGDLCALDARALEPAPQGVGRQRRRLTLRRRRLPDADRAAQRLEHAIDVFGIKGQLPLHQRALGHDEVGEVVRVGDPRGIDLLHAHTRAEETRRVERLAGGGHTLGAWAHAVDAQLGALGKLIGQAARVVAHHQAVALRDASGADDVVSSRLDDWGQRIAWVG